MGFMQLSYRPNIGDHILTNDITLFVTFNIGSIVISLIIITDVHTHDIITFVVPINFNFNNYSFSDRHTDHNFTNNSPSNPSIETIANCNTFTHHQPPNNTHGINTSNDSNNNCVGEDAHSNHQSSYHSDRPYNYTIHTTITIPTITHLVSFNYISVNNSVTLDNPSTKWYTKLDFNEHSDGSVGCCSCICGHRPRVYGSNCQTIVQISSTGKL